MIPGFVFGGLALIACALFILWGLFHCCAACCRCCRRKRARARKPSGLVAQFASSEDVLPAAEVGGTEFRLPGCATHASQVLEAALRLVNWPTRLACRQLVTLCSNTGTRGPLRCQGGAARRLLRLPRALAPAAADAGAGCAGGGHLGADRVHPVNQHNHLNLLVKPMMLAAQ